MEIYKYPGNITPNKYFVKIERCEAFSCWKSIGKDNMQSDNRGIDGTQEETSRLSILSSCSVLTIIIQIYFTALMNRMFQYLKWQTFLLREHRIRTGLLSTKLSLPYTILCAMETRLARLCIFVYWFDNLQRYSQYLASCNTTFNLGNSMERAPTAGIYLFIRHINVPPLQNNFFLNINKREFELPP